jgi:hypothetical protein
MLEVKFDTLETLLGYDISLICAKVAAEYDSVYQLARI